MLCVLVVHAWQVTYGTWRFDEEERTWGLAFDSLSRSLLRWSTKVDFETIAWEGVTIEGRTTLVFGPFPALLRILPNWLAPGRYGTWSRSSCYLASIVALLCFCALATHALRVNGRLTPSARQGLLGAGILGFSLGTPLAYLTSCSRIYHEAALWGLAGSMLALLGLVKLTVVSRDAAPGERGRDGWLVLVAAGFCIALLGRVTFGIPLAGAFAILWLDRAIGWGRARDRASRLRTAAPIVLAGLIALSGGLYQLWYNYDRFGSAFRAIDFHGRYDDPKTMGGTFNARRIPSALENYFGPTLGVSPYSPFLECRLVEYREPKLFLGWREQVVSMSLASSWLLVGAGIGIVLLLRPAIRWARALTLLFVVQAVVVSAFYFVTQRYEADFMPLFVWLYAVFLARVSARGLWGWALVGLQTLLVAGSILTTTGTTLHWNLLYNGDCPPVFRLRLGQLLTKLPPLPPARGRAVYLSSLPVLGQTAAFMPLARNTVFDGSSITFRGIAFEKGLGMHAEHEATWAVPEGAVSFESYAGLPDSANGCYGGSVMFLVRDDQGRELFRSPVMRNTVPPVSISVPLRGVKTLTLVVTDGGDGNGCDHGTWGAAAFRVEDQPPPEGGKS